MTQEPEFVVDLHTHYMWILLLVTAYDEQTSSSYLLILDAVSLDLVARSNLPQSVPFSLHGAFFPDL